ncbi:hypothetical protein HU200_066950 [Digitaria exilis]|uniref:C3H1-type domain-containing protein n=1 Tax=Digitaria exilis TaxID=1010633 RepID=A0A835DSK7_9POAL|nr:hypothetical protein HU200_066950 [Digitaria exilis]
MSRSSFMLSLSLFIRVPCKFYLHGACFKGDYCEFSHDCNDQPDNVTHILLTLDHFSLHYLILHLHDSVFLTVTLSPTEETDSWLSYQAVQNQTSQHPAHLPICSSAAAGTCPYGKDCSQMHGDLCAFCEKQCLHPYRPDESGVHVKLCKKNNSLLEALRKSEDIECVPSITWYSSKEEKQGIVEGYKAKLRSIDCKHFDFGKGTCPFGSSCFYKVHLCCLNYNGGCQSPSEFFHAYSDGRLEDALLNHNDADDTSAAIGRLMSREPPPRAAAPYCMRPPATRMENTAEHATARADAAPPAAAPVTGAGAGGTPTSISCAEAAANITADTATSNNTARDAIAKRYTERAKARGSEAGAEAVAKLSEAEKQGEIRQG